VKCYYPHKYLLNDLKFMGTCIVIYSYSKTNQMHQFLKLFISKQHCTCFGRSFRPSSGVQDCTYSNRHMSNRYGSLVASGNEMELSSISFPLAAGISSCLTYACCCMYSLEHLMMDGKTVRNMYSVV
jgi:hypothetical protein